MQTDIDIEKIRQKLEKAEKSLWYEKPKYITQALSLLPKPCEKVFNCRHFRGYNQSVPMPFGSGNCSEPLGDCAIESESEDCCLECPDYEEAACQAPAGDEFVKVFRQLLDNDNIGASRYISQLRHFGDEALSHLTAQAKAIAVQDEDIASFQEDLLKEAKRGDQLEKIINYAGGSPPPGNLQFVDILQPLEAKVEELEANEKCKPCYGISCPHWPTCFPEMHSDIKELDTKVTQLEAEKKGLEEEILGLMLAIFEGSKGERKRINAELFEKRRKDFGMENEDEND